MSSLLTVHLGSSRILLILYETHPPFTTPNPPPPGRRPAELQATFKSCKSPQAGKFEKRESQWKSSIQKVDVLD